MPRTAGGAINPQRAAEAYFAAKERDQGSLLLKYLALSSQLFQLCTKRQIWRVLMVICTVVEWKRFNDCEKLTPENIDRN